MVRKLLAVLSKLFSRRRRPEPDYNGPRRRIGREGMAQARRKPPTAPVITPSMLRQARRQLGWPRIKAARASWIKGRDLDILEAVFSGIDHPPSADRGV